MFRGRSQPETRGVHTRKKCVSGTFTATGIRLDRIKQGIHAVRSDRREFYGLYVRFLRRDAARPIFYDLFDEEGAKIFKDFVKFVNKSTISRRRFSKISV